MSLLNSALRSRNRMLPNRSVLVGSPGCFNSQARLLDAVWCIRLSALPSPAAPAQKPARHRTRQSVGVARRRYPGSRRGPTLSGIEGDDARRTAILIVQQLADERLVVGIRPSRARRGRGVPSRPAPDRYPRQLPTAQLMARDAYATPQGWLQLRESSDGAKSWSRGGVDGRRRPILCRKTAIRS